jgi:hypothetical protein
LALADPFFAATDYTISYICQHLIRGASLGPLTQDRDAPERSTLGRAGYATLPLGHVLR